MQNLAITQTHFSTEISTLLGSHIGEKHPKTVTPVIGEIAPDDRKLQVVWLRQSGADYTKVGRLQGRFLSSGLRVQLFEGVESLSNIEPYRQMLFHADLVLLEAFGRIGRETFELLLSGVRQCSIAPIVMLTEDASAERTVLALKAGADATVLLNMPEDVIMARMYSLLRRWVYPKLRT